MSRASRKTAHRKLTLIDLFAGAGGTGYGFQRAGFSILEAIEIEPSATETYSKNLRVKVTPSDITKIKPSRLRRKLKLKKGELDVLVGCPPCQGFSRMRNMEGRKDSRNKLVLKYFEFVDEFKPRFAVFENVPGLVRTPHGKRYSNRLISQLKTLGYSVIQHAVDVADYGVPQHRKRIIIVAGRDGEEPPFPQPTHGNPRSQEVKSGSRKKWLTVRDAVKKYPKLRAGENGEKRGRYPNHVAPETGKRVLAFIQKVPADGGSRRDVPKRYWIKCHRGHEGHNDVYGRLSWGSPSGTITTGCTNISKGRFVHPCQDRAITPREAAALQGFPKKFVFRGTALHEQIGNAVPPPLARAIGIELARRLHESDG